MMATRKKAFAAPRTGLPGWKILALTGALAVVLVLLAANAHLAYVAFVSQPDCVPHLKNAGEGGIYRAARSSC